MLSDPRLAIGNPNVSALTWLRDGRLAFNLIESDQIGSLYQIRVDPADGAITGALTKITDSQDGRTLWVSVSADGSRLVVSKERSWSDIYSVDLHEKGPGSIPSDFDKKSDHGLRVDTRRQEHSLRVQPNGQISRSFRQQIGHEDAEALVQGSDDEHDPALSPDGNWILYWSTIPGSKPSSTKQLTRFPVSGGSPEKVLDAGNDDSVAFACGYSPAAGCILFAPKA